MTAANMPEAGPEAAARRGRPTRGWRQRLSSLRECPTDTRRCVCGNVVTDTRRGRARARETPKPRRYTGRLPRRKEDEDEDEEDDEEDDEDEEVVQLVAWAIERKFV